MLLYIVFAPPLTSVVIGFSWCCESSVNTVGVISTTVKWCQCSGLQKAIKHVNGKTYIRILEHSIINYRVGRAANDIRTR